MGLGFIYTALFQSWNTFMKSALNTSAIRLHSHIDPHSQVAVITSQDFHWEYRFTVRRMLQDIFPVCFRTLWHAARRRSNHNLERETLKSSWCCLCMLWMSMTIYLSKRVHLRCQWVYVSTSVQNGHEKYFEWSTMTRQTLQKYISIIWLAFLTILLLDLLLNSKLAWTGWGFTKNSYLTFKFLFKYWLA